MRSSALFLLALLALFAGCVRQKFNDLALHPSSVFTVTPEDFGLEYEILRVPTDDAVIHAWFFPAEGADTAVLVCGGNGGNKSLYLPLARELVGSGYHAVLFDYRGYGLSGGEPDLWSLVPDTLELLRSVRARPEVRSVGMVGLSLGSVVAMGVTEDAPREVQAVVVEGTFLPTEMLDRFAGGFLGTLAAPFVIPSGWDVEDNAEDLGAPALFLHGPEDSVTPLLPVARVFAEATEDVVDGPIRDMWIAEGAGHVPGIAGLYGREFARHVTRFFDAFVRGTGPDPRIRAVWSRAAGGPLRIDLASLADRLEPAPAEVAVVFPGGEVAFRTTWIAPDASTRIEMPAAEDPVLVTATAPAGPVVREGDGWSRSDDYFRSRREFDLRESALLSALDAGMMLHVGGTLAHFRIIEEDRPAVERLAAAREAEVEIEKVLSAPVHPWVRPLYADLFELMGDLRAELGDEEGAYRAYSRCLDLVPGETDSWFWFGDASWRFGWSRGKIATIHRTLAEIAPAAESREAHMLRAAEWEALRNERKRWLSEWEERQREGER